MGCLCRRSSSYSSDVDVAALSTLPSNLDPTLLISQRSLGRRLTHVLQASNKQRLQVAYGKTEIHAHGAKAFASDPESANGTGVRVCLSPVQEALPDFSDAQERESAQTTFRRGCFASVWRITGGFAKCNLKPKSLSRRCETWSVPGLYQFVIVRIYRRLFHTSSCSKAEKKKGIECLMIVAWLPKRRFIFLSQARREPIFCWRPDRNC